MLIQEKAKSLFDNLRAKADKSPKDETFAVSHGWFHCFKKQANLHHVSVSSESASANKPAAKKFPKMLKEIIDKEGYTLQQIFNIEKKIPEKTYINREEKTMPGFKAAKDRQTLLLGGNCSGGMKLKPLLVYHAGNPQALKNITKSSLPIIWMSNKNACVTCCI
ncbi:tigger transposable element-derived protein 1-like [Macrobrachium rosenbergii]|uniref:tigger transposable element-derived protein 1-like n=1 Tax=Macrobrachium rosenbergii TaxID=79674 RepID=UPI0034D5951F